MNSDKLDSESQSSFLGVSELEAVALAKEYDIILSVAGLEWVQALLDKKVDLTGLTSPPQD